MSSAWSERWRAVPENGSPRVARRLARGRALQRSGRVAGLRHGSGFLRGNIQDDRPAPYPATIELPTLSDAAWDTVVATLAADIRHGARLLAGQPPEGLEQRLAARGVELFPVPRRVACDCRDPARWCAHAGALWEAFGAAIDEDPFHLFRILGRGRQQLLDLLASARSRPTAVERPQGRPLEALQAPVAELSSVVLPEPVPPPTEAGLLRLLGDPPGWKGGVTAEALLGPFVRNAARWAWEQQVLTAQG